MKTIVAFAALLAVALGAPQLQRGSAGLQPEVVLVKETPHNNIGVDGYQYFYELSDGQTRDERAELVQLRNAETNELVPAYRVTGSYSFVAADGQLYTVTYVADENGFQPQGAHLPKA